MSVARGGGWGNLPGAEPARTLARDWRFEPLPAGGPLLAVGMQRSYGDVCANGGGTVLSTRWLDRLVAFDVATGRLECEAGVTLGEILRVVLAHGWYLPVVPGTRFVTLGGAVANDVHGKNHGRAGSFGCHVLELELLRSDRGRLRCSESENAELFRATIGGLGLTGLITRVALQLRRVPGAGMEVQELRFASLAQLTALIGESAGWEYSVAWVDGSRLARGVSGVLSRAEHAEGPAAEPRAGIGVPFVPPLGLVNDVTAWGFSRLYALTRREGARRLDHAAYFFPLDGVRHWNRLYGPRGFHQYQCVLAPEGVAPVLAAVHALGPVSPLIVLKDFGARRSPGLLSFPRPGITLAMDFAGGDRRLPALFARLDAIVREHGGALYPAKDARMDRAMFAASFPALERFAASVDPRFSSSFWRRVQ